MRNLIFSIQLKLLRTKKFPVAKFIRKEKSFSILPTVATAIFIFYQFILYHYLLKVPRTNEVGAESSGGSIFITLPCFPDI